MDKNSSSEYNNDCNCSSIPLPIMVTSNLISVCTKVRHQRYCMTLGDVPSNYFLLACCRTTVYCEKLAVDSEVPRKSQIQDYLPLFSF